MPREGSVGEVTLKWVATQRANVPVDQWVCGGVAGWLAGSLAGWLAGWLLEGMDRWMDE